jgi:Protein of unknown function (DUF4089)
MTRADCERWLDAMAAANGLVIDPAWREGVLANLARIAEQHDLVASFDLAHSPVPASRFEP